MPEEIKVAVNDACWLDIYIYDSGEVNVWLEYIEHSPDPWYGNTETSIDIDKETAIKIVKALKEAFKI